eukprot:jgi/Picsp_1/1521/NSC_04999-R1_galactose-binding protein
MAGSFGRWFVTCLLLLSLLPVPTSLRTVEIGSNQGHESSVLHSDGNIKVASDGKGTMREGEKVPVDVGLEGSIAEPSLEEESTIRANEAHDILSTALNVVFSGEESCVLPNFGQIEGLSHMSPCSVEGKAEETEQNIGMEDTTVKDKGQMEMEKITETVLEVLPDSSQANFAVGREGAKVLASNPGAKRVGALLDVDADTFMRNDCKDDKWVVIELSQVARVSSVEISQHELYSSRVKEFDVYGMASHPRTLAMESSTSIDRNAWNFMGKFEGGKAKGTQSFKVQSPGWVRYLLIRFLTHHGSESVCAINGLAVYGTSAAEELEAQLADEGLALGGLGEPGANSGILGKERELEDKVAPGTAGANNSQTTGSDDSTHQIQKEMIKDTSGANATSRANSTKVGGNAGDALNTQKDAGKVEEKGGTLNKTTTESSESDLKGIKENNQSNRMSQTDGAKNQIFRPNVKPGLVPPVTESMVSSSKINKTGALAGNLSLLNETDTVSDALKGDTLSVGAPAPFDPHDLTLPVPKPKQGGTVYEILVQELKATKAQQKLVSKALESMHRDLEKLATEMVEIRKQSASLRAADSIVSRIEVSEQLVESLRRSMKNQNRAGVSLLASCVGILVLNIDIMKPSRKALKLITHILVASNAVLGVFLMLKSTFVSQMHTPSL